MEIKDRIKLCRKQLKLTQEDFSGQINVSRSNLANIESGLVNLTDRVINDICSAFNISEIWLRTGDGEMFAQLTRDEYIAAWMGKILQDEPENKFIKKFVGVLAQLETKDWATLEKIANMLAQKKD